MLRNSPFGVCSAAWEQTNAPDWNYYTATTSYYAVPDQPTYEQTQENLDPSGAKTFEGLEEHVTIEYSWERLYSGLQAYLTLTDNMSGSKWLQGIAPETYQDIDEDAWAVYLFGGDGYESNTNFLEVNEVTFSYGQVLGEIFYHYRQLQIEDGMYSQSAYNKAWVGDGVLRGEDVVIGLYSDRSPDVDSIISSNYIADPIWGYNERGYLCFNKKDKFKITDLPQGIDNKEVSASEVSFVSERSMSTGQCLRRDNLANSTGAQVYTFGCSDYLSAQARIGNRPLNGLGIDTYSACCTWAFNTESGCVDYMSYKNPYRCDRLELRDTDVYGSRHVLETFGSCASNHLVTDPSDLDLTMSGEGGDDSCPTVGEFSYVSYTEDPDNNQDIMALPFNNGVCSGELRSLNSKGTYRKANEFVREDALNANITWRCQQGKFEQPVSEKQPFYLCKNRQYRYHNLPVPDTWFTEENNGEITAVCFPPGKKSNNPQNPVYGWESYFPAATAGNFSAEKACAAEAGVLGLSGVNRDEPCRWYEDNCGL